jgi:hypothetical protein
MNSSYNINKAEQQMMNYLDGKLSGTELYQFEKQMADSSMLNDAVEGLQILENTNKINSYVTDLNKQLKKYTSSKKKRRIKNHLELNDWTSLAIILVITLCIIGYFVVKLLK